MNDSESVLRFYFTELKWSSFSASMKTSIIIFIGLAIFFIVMGQVFRKMNKKDSEVPTKGLKFLCILLVDSINKFVRNNIGEKNVKLFAPYFIGVASFISFANISSVFGLNPPFSNLGVALTLSIIAFLLFQFTGIKFQGLKNRIKGFLGPVKGVSFLVFPISIIGEITTPFSMGMRMFGNIFSGVVIGGVVFALSNVLTELLGSVIFGGIISTLFITTIIHPIFDIFFDFFIIQI